MCVPVQARKGCVCKSGRGGCASAPGESGRVDMEVRVLVMGGAGTERGERASGWGMGVGGEGTGGCGSLRNLTRGSESAARGMCGGVGKNPPHPRGRYQEGR